MDYIPVEPEVETIKGLTDTQTMCHLFNRSELTILNWRQSAGMPYVLIPGERNAIRYRVRKVLAWARRTGRQVYPVDGIEIKSCVKQISA